MRQKLVSILNSPLQIGGGTIPNRLVLAPMTYLGHVAFRRLLEELGHHGLMFSEMCSAVRLPQENRRISGYFRWRDEEADRLIVQIVGADPAKMAGAAQRIESEGFFGVDINLGCTVKGICRFRQGAALLKEPDTAVGIVRRVRQAVRCPVTVKFRIGWQDESHNPVEMARRLEDAGADALTFHPRIAPDRRNRPPRWEYIARVKQAVRIPVFGNGNVFDAEDCFKMLSTTGCDGIALGRLAIARPWVFALWSKGVQPPETILRDAALRLCRLLPEHFDSVRALRRYKRYATYLSANFVFGNHLFNCIQKAADFDEIESVLVDFFDNDPQLLKRLNINFLR